MVKAKKEKVVKKEGDFTTYSQAELRLSKECKSKGFQVRGDKKDLIDRLNGKGKLATPISKKPKTDKPKASPKTDTKSPKKSSKPEATGLAALSQADLRALAKKHDVKGLSGTKLELIKKLTDAGIKSE